MGDAFKAGGEEMSFQKGYEMGFNLGRASAMDEIKRMRGIIEVLVTGKNLKRCCGNCNLYKTCRSRRTMPVNLRCGDCIKWEMRL